MSHEEPTAAHEPVTDATRVDFAAVVRRDQERNPLIEVPPPGKWKPTGLRTGDSVTIVASRAMESQPMRSVSQEAPALDYSDVDDAVTRSIRTAEMLASLRVSGEQVDPAATEATLARIRDLRLALGGIGQVGQHFNAVGTPVAEEVAVILTVHDLNALIMRLTGKVRFETI